MRVAALRKKIDALDRRLVSLLNARARVAVQIGKLKQVRESDVYVPAREKAVLAHVRRVNRGPLGGEAIDSIYREIMSSARALERQIRVAHFGQATTFTHQAARQRFGGTGGLSPVAGNRRRLTTDDRHQTPARRRRTPERIYRA